VIGQPGIGVSNYVLGGNKVSQVVLSQVQDLVNATVTAKGGVTTLQFSRPLNSASAAIQLSPDQTQQHIWGFNAGQNTLSQHSDYGVATINLGQCSSAKPQGSSNKLSPAQAHGLLMALGFAVLLPLGALLGRFGKVTYYTSACFTVLIDCIIKVCIVIDDTIY
jgi:hypothetical protein